MTVTILTGDARAVLASLPASSFQTCVTSPPYYGLRDYGVEGQIGLEETPAEYVTRLVDVFGEVRRVLRDDGTLWLNIGDSYAGSWGAGSKRMTPEQEGWRNSITNMPKNARRMGAVSAIGIKPKDMFGIPWMLAFALRADGWYLRSDVIWHKLNPMPESTRDRPTSAHEHVFLLAKEERYFYDGEAIKEAVSGGAHDRGSGVNPKARANAVGAKQNASFSAAVTKRVESRNARNVWSIATEPFSAGRLDGWEEDEDHHAVMPPALAERCIRAGTSERGACPHCGAPWVRVLGEAEPLDGRGSGNGFKRPARLTMGGELARGDEIPWTPKERPTVAWSPSCSCQPHDPVPQHVLDPFGGAGTTGLVADRLGRHATLIELKAEYAALARTRITADGPLFADCQAGGIAR